MKTKTVVKATIGLLLIIAIGVGIGYLPSGDVTTPQNKVENTTQVQGNNGINISIASATTPVAVVDRSSNSVDQKTEAALAQFGLSMTSLVKITVVAQARPPVILPNQSDSNR